MNKKTKSFAVGIVAVLCFLLVFAIGFGVTGAWYQAQRQASGTVKMDQEIYLKFTNLGNLEPAGAGDIKNKIEGQILDSAGNVLGSAQSTQSSIEPGQPVTIKNPTIAAAASSVDFYARVKVTYQAKYFMQGQTGPRTDWDLESNPVTISPETMQQLFGDELTGQLKPGSDWVANTDGYWYFGTGTKDDVTLVRIVAGDGVDGENHDLFANGNIKFADWTAGKTDIEGGGPTVMVDHDSNPETPAVAREIGQILITIDIEVIQAENMTTAPTGWTGVTVPAA